MIKPKNIAAILNLKNALQSHEFQQVTQAAFEQNPWFTPDMVARSAQAICNEFLDESTINTWLENYTLPSDFKIRRVGIIAAGNIPMVCFADLLAALVVGHNITIKPSSKDRLLIEFIVANLPQFDIDIVDKIDRFDIDLLIATGSTTTTTSVSNEYKGIPSLLRGTRHSVAKLNGNETSQQLYALSDDIFLYHGLGCRNVSHIYLPKGYDIEKLIPYIRPFICKEFDDNVRYQRAQKAIMNEKFTDCRSFLMQETESHKTTKPLGILGYTFFETAPLIDISEIQCTVGFEAIPCNVDFGETQSPSLLDYADGIDTINFLIN